MKQRNNIVGIDCIRFSAALLVALYHLSFMEFHSAQAHLVGYLGPTPIADFLWPISFFGWVGVQIFFVISGFVIAYSAEKATAFSFFRSRFVRLYPAVWIFSLIALPAVILVKDVPLVLAAKMFVKTILIYPVGPWLEGVLWTLPNEMAFYLVIFVLLVLGRFSVAHLVIYAIGLVSSAYWLVYLYCLLNPALADVALHMRGLSWGWQLQLSLVHFGCFFALGFLLWRWLLKGETRLERLVAPVLVAGCLVEMAGKTAEDVAAVDMALPAWPGYLAWALAMAALVLSVRYREPILRATERVPGGVGLSRRLGLMTYNMYLLHVPVSLMAVAMLAGLDIASSILWLVGFAAVLAVSWIVTVHWEPVVQNGVKHIFDSRRLSVAARARP